VIDSAWNQDVVHTTMLRLVGISTHKKSAYVLPELLDKSANPIAPADPSDDWRPHWEALSKDTYNALYFAHAREVVCGNEACLDEDKVSSSYQ
jgi:hypothetical protein